jgi:metal-responsive CopG/Arc/MetJ family transcriptional regulator
MGRPHLNVLRISVYLPADMPGRIDALVGAQKRSEFIRAAVLGALETAEMTAAAKAKKP